MRATGIVVATVVLIVLGLVVTGRFPFEVLGGEPAAEPPAKPAATLRLVRVQAPQGSSLGLCLDPSTSTDGRFAISVRDELATAVGAHLLQRPAQTKAGVAAAGGLEVTVRLVSTRPLAYGEPYVEVRIPPVDGLPPRPDMTSPGALDPGGPYLTWKALETQWAADYGRALDAQAAAAGRLAHLDVARAQQPDVRDCVAALTTVPAVYENASVVVASDPEENAYTGAVPDLHGEPVVIVQPCPDGEAGRCGTRFAEFSRWAQVHGAGSVAQTRPEAAAAALISLVTPDR